MKDKQNQVTAKELRQFGCGLGVILLVIGGVLLWRGAIFGAIVICVAFAVAHVFWWQWRGTRELYARWMAVARVLSKVMTTVVLTLLYFMVLTPIALLARLFDKRFLDRSFDKSCDSYWIVRDPATQRHNSEKQF